MSKYLPTNELRWLTDKEIKNLMYVKRIIHQNIDILYLKRWSIISSRFTKGFIYNLLIIMKNKVPFTIFTNNEEIS